MKDPLRTDYSFRADSSESPVRPFFSVVVPVFNSLPYLADCITSIQVAAARASGIVEIVAVDNGSTDGSYELLGGMTAPFARVEKFQKRNIAAVRNFGAASARGTYLCFLDSDVVIPSDYFDRAREALASSSADATGCEVTMPSPASWVEVTWGALHQPTTDSFVHYINSANLIVSADAFRAIGGFDEALVTGEETEFGQRLLERGYRIYQSRRVSAVHLRNPTTMRQFFMKQLWHGRGALGTVNISSVDKPFAMTVLHAALTIAALVALVIPVASVPARLSVALACTLFSPSAAVAYRVATLGVRPSQISKSLVLYHLYFDARAVALVRIAFDSLREALHGFGPAT